jgi:hypothetical protein
MEQLTLSLEGFLAKTCHRQAVVQDLERALDLVFSGKCYDWLAKYGKSKEDFHISSLRMSHGFSAGLRKRRVNGLVSFSTRWPKSGMMQSGFVSPLPVLERRMSGSESALLPTPTKHLSKEGAYPAEYTRNTPTLTAQLADGANGVAVNPRFVEWMMGFPTDHTAWE